MSDEPKSGKPIVGRSLREAADQERQRIGSFLVELMTGRVPADTLEWDQVVEMLGDKLQSLQTLTAQKLPDMGNHLRRSPLDPLDELPLVTTAKQEAKGDPVESAVKPGKVVVS